jgi:nitrite reductase/ring-hydroxylating ferredoxin subunit
MTEPTWQRLTGINPAQSAYPARAILDNEGIIVLRTRHGYRGVQRVCPHMQATMMDAELVGDEMMIRCPRHVFTFRLSDGKGVNCPGFRLHVFEIKEESDALYGRRLG